MGMAFPQACTRDPHKTRLFLKIRNVAAANITHGSPQATCQLMQNAAKRTFVWHLTFDTFRYKLETVAYFRLEIAIGRATCHGADGPHAPIGFVGSSLVQIDFAWAFFARGVIVFVGGGGATGVEGAL